MVMLSSTSYEDIEELGKGREGHHLQRDKKLKDQRNT